MSVPKLAFRSSPGRVDLTIDGIPLTPEESEAAAVLVCAMRSGRKFTSLGGKVAVSDARGFDVWDATPSAAYEAALKAEGES